MFKSTILVFLLSTTALLHANGMNSKNIIVPQTLMTGDAVVPQDDAYYTYKLKDRDIEIIYTEENIPFAKHTVEMEEQLHKDYEEFFNWKFDETLHVGLISNQNQIANGFSTQWPNNRQINYIGGSELVDYFSNTSWLDVLLYHETTHNYQLNTKASGVSQAIHSFLGNGTFLLPIPYVVVPNMAENSFMLEGNAVLNESWHATGGRLYNGRFRAMMTLQAKAGNITPHEMYNSTLNFPYAGDVYYQIGGFYNLYLAEKYGTKKVDSYFYNKSKDWFFPFYTNAAMEETVGSDFETTLKEYADFYADKAKNLVVAQGEKLAESQFYSPLSSSKEEIFFITNETGYRAPELVVIQKKDLEITKDRDSWLSGKVIKVDDEYYTQGSSHTSPIRITQGLYNDGAFIKDGTESKIVHGYLSDGRAVYFDVPSSYDYPQLYVGDKHYGYANSSVIIDKDDNIYYFANKNKGKERTLYKNKTPLFTFQGFYGMVADVDSSGAVYFIANSELGTTLYRYKEGKVTRASAADNILDARLLNDNEIVASAVGEEEYYYVKNELVTIEQEPYEVKLFFEDKEYYRQYTSKDTQSVAKDLDTSNSYYSLFDMHYSGSDFSIGKSKDDAIVGALNLNFGDPLSQNSANIFVSRDDTNITIAGAGYQNTQYLLQYSISAYGVVDDYDRNDTRSSGIIANANIPFYQAGYYNGNLGATYFQDYDTAEREPLTASLMFSRYEGYGKSMYSNYTNGGVIYGVKERDDSIYGGLYSFAHDLGYEFYFEVSGKYSQTDSTISDATAKLDTRGVKVSDSAFIEDNDISTIYMPTIDDSAYFKRVAYADIGFSKVLNFSSYWFTFPISLQRESIYTKYRYYDLKKFDETLESVKVNEIMAGLRFDLVFLNSAVMPISFEYYHNDNDQIAKDEHQFKFLIGSSF